MMVESNVVHMFGLLVVSGTIQQIQKCVYGWRGAVTLSGFPGKVPWNVN